MELFNELSISLKPANQNLEMECCGKPMIKESFGHVENRTYDHPGDWIKDYDIYKCTICNEEIIS